MSTRVSIKSRDPSAGLPSFHLYEDVLDSFGMETEVEQPVYLQLDGVDVRFETTKTGAASVTVVLPRAVARELGLLASDTRTSKLHTDGPWESS